MVSRTDSLAGELLSDSSPAKLLHGDLHFDNVLASKRADWLAIDPKPCAGQPGWEVHALLRNRVEELRAAASFRAAVRRRLEIVAEAAGIDPETARHWSLVHTGIQAGWAAAANDKDATSLNIALFKALED
jgi:streptomycin 6-kinase